MATSLTLMNADDIIKKFEGIDVLFISAKEHTHVNLLEKTIGGKSYQWQY